MQNGITKRNYVAAATACLCVLALSGSLAAEAASVPMC